MLTYGLNEYKGGCSGRETLNVCVGVGGCNSMAMKHPVMGFRIIKAWNMGAMEATHRMVSKSALYPHC